MGKYDDMIEMKHWEPRTRPRMSAMDRAAQFAPFAALTGYDAMVSETARLTESMQETDEEQCQALNSALSDILGRIAEHPHVRITWFRKDPRKAGGAYVETEGHVRDVELHERCIVLKEGDRISFDDIRSII